MFSSVEAVSFYICPVGTGAATPAAGAVAILQSRQKNNISGKRSAYHAGRHHSSSTFNNISEKMCVISVTLGLQGLIDGAMRKFIFET